MRKLSKSRTDDDIVSSTNGSVNNDEPVEKESGDIKQDEQPTEDSVNDKDSDNEIVEPPKKRGSKNKTKKRKSNKEHLKAEKSDDEEEYEVEKVIDSKKVKGRIHYLIRWKGYGADSDTWEPENTLSCPDLINKFNEEVENSKNDKKDEKTPKKGSKKRQAAKNSKNDKPKVKRAKTQEWDGKNADENAEYEVERILEVHHKKNGKREFLIHWKGWSNRYDSWEPESNLNCPELINRFMSKVSAARSVDSRNLRVNPETTQRFTLQDPSSGRRLSKRRGQRQRIRYDGTE